MLVPSKETPIAAPNGSFCFGDIPHVPGAGGTILCNEGKVILPFGDVSFGFTHIKRKHEKKINHYYRNMNVESYIQIAANGYQKLYLEKDGRLWLLKFNGVVKTVVVAEYSIGPLLGISSAQYKVITGYPLERLPDFKKRGAQLLWER